MGRASIIRVLVAVAVIAIGISTVAVPATFFMDSFRGPVVGMMIVLSTTVVGAGIGLIFKRQLWGALIGFCVGIAIVILASRHEIEFSGNREVNGNRVAWHLAATVN